MAGFDLFANPETLEFDFNGVKVTLKKYIDAGVHEDLENESNRIRFLQNREGESVREITMNGGRLKMLQHMLISILEKDGTTHYQPFSEELLSKLSREAFMVLTDAIDEHNVPLVELRTRKLLDSSEIEAGLIQRLQPNEISSTSSPESETPTEETVPAYEGPTYAA